MVGMICTQYKRHFLVWPRPISAQAEPGTTIGTPAMAFPTVAGDGPSESLQAFGGAGRGVGGFEPQPAAARPKITRIALSRRRTPRA